MVCLEKVRGSQEQGKRGQQTFSLVRNVLFASTAKLRRQQRGLGPRDVSQREATQRGAGLKQ